MGGIGWDVPCRGGDGDAGAEELQRREQQCGDCDGQSGHVEKTPRLGSAEIRDGGQPLLDKTNY